MLEALKKNAREAKKGCGPTEIQSRRRNDGRVQG